MVKPKHEFKSVTPDYGFSSDVETEGDKRVNYMHVIARGCKLDNLQRVIKQQLTVAYKADTPLKGGNRNIRYIGRMQGVEYKFLLEYGECPTGDGGNGHNIEIETPSTSEDGLSPIIEREMRQYEAEMTAERQRINEFVRTHSVSRY
ncbi:hypothetical protein HYW20_02020 [Candidatus Woesearchaeota archaeon]|nr:hypothetical protein [Candidatus Woesearchaeota archaeon]